MNKLEIEGRAIGPGEPVYIIAEAGVNHNGSLEQAKLLVRAAKESGADAVKFQTFKADLLAGETAELASYQKRAGSRASSQRDMLQALELNREMHDALRHECRRSEITFLSTPFDDQSLALICDIDVPAIKVGSGEVTNLPFLSLIARTGKPVLLSTGMSTLDEVSDAYACLVANGANSIALFHCVSNYPAALADQNLRAITTMRERFGVPVGFSDHTQGFDAACLSVALGASILEKHLTMDQEQAGPDHAASETPDGFVAMIRKIRQTEVALGDGVKQPKAAEQNVMQVARKSLVAGCDIAKGQRIVAEMIVAKRPGTGISPAQLSTIVGRIACTDIPKESVLAMELFE